MAGDFEKGESEDQAPVADTVVVMGEFAEDNQVLTTKESAIVGLLDAMLEREAEISKERDTEDSEAPVALFFRGQS